MSTSRTLVETLIGAIPAEEGATLVARVGERARISSSSGSIDVGSVPLTADVIDDLSAQLLAPEQMQMLRDTGTVQVEFTAANRAGDFAMLAGSTGDDRWLEVRRRIRSATTATPGTPAAPPSEATVAAELLSRFHSKDRSRTSAAAPTAVRTGAPQTAQAPATEIATAPLTTPPPRATAPPAELTTPQTHVAAAPVQVAIAPTEPVEPAPGLNPDLDVPTNIEFPESNFDLDDLSVPSGILDQPLPALASAEPARAQAAATPAVAVPQKRGARLSVLLPAAAVLVIGLPAVGWFTWTRYFPTGQVKAAPVSPAIPHPKPAATASLPSVRPTAPAVAPQASQPAQTRPAPPAPPSASPSVAAVAPPKAPIAPAPPKPVPSAPPAKETPVAATTATARHDARPRVGFSVQVAAVHARDEADRMAAKLVQQGYAGYVVNGEGAAADFFRVRIGTFPDRHAAEDVARKIELSEGITPWIVKETR